MISYWFWVVNCNIPHFLGNIVDHINKEKALEINDLHEKAKLLISKKAPKPSNEVSCIILHFASYLITYYYFLKNIALSQNALVRLESNSFNVGKKLLTNFILM